MENCSIISPFPYTTLPILLVLVNDCLSPLQTHSKCNISSPMCIYTQPITAVFHRPSKVVCGTMDLGRNTKGMWPEAMPAITANHWGVLPHGMPVRRIRHYRFYVVTLTLSVSSGKTYLWPPVKYQPVTWRQRKAIYLWILYIVSDCSGQRNIKARWQI